jgi:hypothetical protein
MMNHHYPLAEMALVWLLQKFNRICFFLGNTKRSCIAHPLKKINHQGVYTHKKVYRFIGSDLV